MERQLEHEGRRFRGKDDSAKEWFTPLGRGVVSRQEFRSVDRRGGGFCPLDLRCGMQMLYLIPDGDGPAAYFGA